MNDRAELVVDSPQANYAIHAIGNFATFRSS